MNLGLFRQVIKRMHYFKINTYNKNHVLFVLVIFRFSWHYYCIHCREWINLYFGCCVIFKWKQPWLFKAWPLLDFWSTVADPTSLTRWKRNLLKSELDDTEHFKAKSMLQTCVCAPQRKQVWEFGHSQCMILLEDAAGFKQYSFMKGIITSYTWMTELNVNHWKNVYRLNFWGHPDEIYQLCCLCPWFIRPYLLLIRCSVCCLSFDGLWW